MTTRTDFRVGAIVRYEPDAYQSRAGEVIYVGHTLLVVAFYDNNPAVQNISLTDQHLLRRISP